MKLRLSVGQKPISGYVNVDPAPVLEDDKVGQFVIKPIDFRTMEYFDTAKQAECMEILIDRAVDYIRFDALESFISTMCSKLRKYGIIYLIGLDITEVTRKYYNDEITEEEYNLLLFGSGNHPWAFKNGCYSVHTIGDLLVKNGLTIQTKSINDSFYEISGKR